MNREIKRMKIIVLFIIHLFLGTTYTLACSCETWEFDYATEKASEIFLAEIINTEGSVDNSPQITKFKILKKWKGSSDREIVIYSGITGCDNFFHKDYSKYLIYANKEDLTKKLKDFNNRNIASLCSRTIAKEYIKKSNWFEEDQIKLNDKYQLVKLENENHIELLIFITIFIGALIIIWKNTITNTV